MNLQHFALPPLELEAKEVKDVVRCLLHTILFNRALGSLKPREADCDVFDITYTRCDDAAIVKAVDERVDHFDAAFAKTLAAASKLPAGSTGSAGTGAGSHPSGTGASSGSSASGSSAGVGSGSGGGSGSSGSGFVAQTCVLSFYEEVSKASWGGLRQAKEKVYWEQWNIPIVLPLSASASASSSAASIAGTAASSGASVSSAAISAPIAIGGGDKKPETASASSASSAAVSGSAAAPASAKGKAGERERRLAARAGAVRDRLLYVVERVNAKMDHIPAFKKGPAVCYPFDIAFVSGLDGSGSHTPGDAGGSGDTHWAVSMLKRVVQAGPPLLIKTNN